MDTSAVFTVDQIRRAEQPLLGAEHRPDELMQAAAAAVASAARLMLARPPVLPTQTAVLLVVGAGGNGGDALYAGRDLVAEGWNVDAVLLGRDRTTGDIRAHSRALEAFSAAGGHVVEAESIWTQEAPGYRLLVDGVLGMGGSGGVDAQAAVVLGYAHSRLVPVLSVDVPSGVDADTGATTSPVTDAHPIGGHPEQFPSHAVADVTVTFGGLRRAHAVSAWCGQVLVADPGLDSGGTIGENLSGAGNRSEVVISTQVAAVPVPDPRKPGGGADAGNPYDPTGTGLFPVARAVGLGGVIGSPREPGPFDDKYTGGVVGICAGSKRFPGAAVLATSGAVRATSAMVRYIGSGADEVLRACPEVVWSADIASAGRVQAWVVGPGRGTDDTAAQELAELLGRPEPLLIDADALTLLAQRPELRQALIQRSPGKQENAGVDAQTLLTPHAGEFRRLAESLGESAEISDPDADRIGAAIAMSRELHCDVLLKGRHTVVVRRAVVSDGSVIDPMRVHCIDAGTSWGATPGSGDVLAGVTGALIANHAGLGDGIAPPQAVALHALAACIAAQTPSGYAPTSASRIVLAVPEAWAQSGAASTLRWVPES